MNARFLPLLMLPLAAASTRADAASKPRALSAKPSSKAWWPASTNAALARAGANRAELGRALRHVPPSQRQALRFLIENAPERDLKTLSAKYLLEDVALAFEARQSAPWRVPDERFQNDVLPYAFLNEARDSSRARLRRLCLPLIVGCTSPGEAAQAINKGLFPLVKVKYSTARQKPDQNASECLASGLASCSGLSILLAGACRSVGIAARVVGTPMWSNGRGNHTWVEVWDNGWHFTGAAEPDAQGLDHAWFAGDAAQAKAEVPAHAIYASTWKKSGLSFPLVWAPSDKSVAAQNVTSRYAQAAPAVDASQTRVLVQVLDANGKRVEVPVRVLDASGKEIGRGVTKSEGADTNDFFSVQAARNSKITVIFGYGGYSSLMSVPFDTGNKAEARLAMKIGPVQILDDVPKSLPPSTPLSPAQQAEVEKAAGDYFALPENQRAGLAFAPTLDALLRANEPAVRAAVWSAWKKAPHVEAKADFEANRVRFGQYESPYVVRTVGTRPAGGWPLFIAMHGGGGAPKEVNDQQYAEMQHHYFDHPELGGYKYLALRAPNDLWNGFYDDYVYPLIGNLTSNFNLFGDINPAKVFLMGYSHGGYGAFAIGPKMPDHFAAIHASAAAPTDGETSAKTLRNTFFTAMVGEHDLAYDRLSRDQKFDALIKSLRGARTDLYPVRVDVAMGFEHGNLNDRDKIVEMYPHSRNPIPTELSWEQTDGVIHDFFWLASTNPAKQHEIDARREGNSITIITTGGATGFVLLDGRMVDFSKPILLDINGRKSQRTVRPSLKTLCETMARRGDPELAFTAEIPFA